MARQPYYESNNPDRFIRGAGRRWMIYICVAVAFFGAIGAGVWAFKVATSDVKGAGDAARQKNSAANRLQAQARYSSLHEGILAADRNIDTLAVAVKEDPSAFNKTNLLGAQNVCAQHVAEYNAMAVNALTAQWRPEELPSRIGDDPTSDCKPNPINPTP